MPLHTALCHALVSFAQLLLNWQKLEVHFKSNDSKSKSKASRNGLKPGLESKSRLD